MVGNLVDIPAQADHEKNKWAFAVAVGAVQEGVAGLFAGGLWQWVVLLQPCPVVLHDGLNDRLFLTFCLGGYSFDAVSSTETQEDIEPLVLQVLVSEAAQFLGGMLP